eukprot:2482220-Amphidinium_carterae.1
MEFPETRKTGKQNTKLLSSSGRLFLEDSAQDISKLAKLPTKKGYDEVVLFARQLAKTIDERPFDERLSALKDHTVPTITIT